MSPAIPSHLRGYELVEKIGTGSFGSVFRARQNTVGREVAIKVILPEFANHPNFIRRFETEAHLVARLEHPHIVPLYDCWREPEGAYLVMQLLRGGSLGSWLKRGPPEIECTLRFMEQITNALAYAHRSRVIHRDIKPGNILLDEDFNAYLSDFGIAGIVMNKTTGEPEAGFQGSLEYVSPEQIQNGILTPQSDIYSLGLVLYEMLTGEHPFKGSTSAELISKHLKAPIPDVYKSRTDLPVKITTVVRQAAAKTPSDRFSDPLQLAAALFEAVGHKSIRASAEGATHQVIMDQLTDRELEVLQWMAQGLSTREIANQLTLSVETIRWYVRQIFEKLSVNRRRAAVAVAQRLDLIKVDIPLPDGALTQALPLGNNPYKGLRAFRQADAHQFFGRDDMINRLLARLGETGKASRFLAVVGPSGSGKSSLVRAGLIPALETGALPGSEKWFITDLMPGSHPFDELELALTRVARVPQPGLREQLQRDERGLLRAAHLLLPDTDDELLLVIDQFEELFTMVTDPNMTRRFLDLLVAVVNEPRSRLRIIVTLRADFFDLPLTVPGLDELMRQRTEAIIMLAPVELEQAIVQPAQDAGVTVEQGLVAAIISEVNGQPGALPLLQYALTELFEQRQGRTMTLTTYTHLGGALGMLARQAEALFDDFSAREQALARQIMMRLVTLGESSAYVRRRVRRSELNALAFSQDSVDMVLGAFGDYRLLTFDVELDTRLPTVEVAHEALIQRWGRLRDWLEESREDIRLQRLLSRMAGEWQQAAQEPSFLLTGSRLRQLQEWADHTSLALTGDERVYLDASLAEHSRREEMESNRFAREVALERRSSLFLRTLVVVLALAALGAIAVSLFAVDREQQAQAARATAEREAAVNYSLVLANHAQQAYSSGKTDLGLALAMEATTIEDPPTDAIRTLSAVALSMGTRAILRENGSRVTSVAFNADSTAALSGSCAELIEGICTAGELIVWNVAMAAEVRRLEGHTGWITSLAFDPTTPHHALSASEDGTLILWNIDTGAMIYRFEGHVSRVNSVVFSPDGSTALSASDDGTVILWDVATAQIIRRFKYHDDRVTCVTVSPNGQMAAAGYADATILLWDIGTGQIVQTLADHTAVILQMNFRINEQGQTVLFSTSYDYSLREWDIQTGEQTRFVPTTTKVSAAAFLPDGRTALICEGNLCYQVDTSSWTLINRFFPPSLLVVTSGTISPDGRLALIGTEVGELILINLPISVEIRRFHSDDGLITVDVSPDGRYLLTGTFDHGTVILWDLRTGEEVRRLEGLESAISVARFSRDGRLAFIGSSDSWHGTPANEAVLWDIETGQVVHELKGHKYYPRAAAFSPDGQSLLVGTMQWGPAWDKEGIDGELVLWDLETGQEIRRFESGPSILDISFSPDGHQVVTSSATFDGVVLWDVETGQPIRKFNLQALPVLFTSDPRYFLAGTGGGVVTLVDVETGTPARQFTGFPGTPWSIRLSVDEQYLFGGDGKGAVILWNFTTGEEIRRFDGHSPTTSIWNATFSPDGQTAFSSSMDPAGEVIQWRIVERPLQELITWISDNRYVRDLTCAERAQYRIPPACDSVAYP